MDVRSMEKATGFSGVFSLIDFAADISKFVIDLAKALAEIAHEQEELFGIEL